MKKVISAVTGILCAVSTLLQFPAVSSAANNTNDIAVNYGTSEKPAFGPNGLINLSVSDPVDSENKEFENMEFGLYNSEGERVAVWTGNDSSTLKIDENFENTVKNPADSQELFVSPKTFENPAGEKGYVRNIIIRSETGEKYEIKNNSYSGADLPYGSEFKATVNYFLEKDTSEPDLVLPAHSFAVYADKGWKDRSITWGFDFTDYGEDDHDYDFSDYPGTVKIDEYPDGDYPYLMFYRSSDGSGGSGGNINNKISITDKQYEYVKKTINVLDTFPSDFNPDRYTDKNFPDIRNFSFKNASDAPYKPAGMIIISGNLVNAPIPDEKGNVTIYVDKATNLINMQTIYAKGGGGLTWCPGYADEHVEYSFNTVKMPENGVNIQLLSTDKYTVRPENLPEEYEFVSDEIQPVVYNPVEPGAEILYSNIYVTVKKYQIDVLKSNRGKLSITPDAPVPGGKEVKLTASPDSGYVIEGYNFFNENGEKIAEETLKISEENTFIMPCENITIEPVFKRSEIIKGDINGDEKINVLDLTIMKKVICLSEILTDAEDKAAADINDDGSVNVFDFLRLKNILLENEGELLAAHQLPDDIF